MTDDSTSNMLKKIKATISQEQKKEIPKKESDVTFTKSKDDEHLVFGWANVAVKADGSIPFDWDGDVKTPDTLEKAAYDFVLKSRATGEMHKGDVKGNLVESIMFTKEKMSAMGIPDGVLPEGWWVGFHVPDPQVFAKIKDGTYKMFSIQGKSLRIPL
jgi:flagellar hook assembly protein FlgD